MRKNLLLAFSLIILTFTIQGSNANEFHQPEWENDYHLFAEEEEKVESARAPSSVTQAEKEQENVESWKYEVPKE